MRVSLEAKSFEKQLENIVQYSYGFLDGVKKGKKILVFLLSYHQARDNSY